MKKYWYRIPLAVGYLLVFASYLYSIYYSMPANDDFAWAINWWSDNRIMETLHRIDWNYNNWFSNSGVFAIVIWVLFHPLYWFENVGHSFGICMIVWNVIIFIGLLWGTRSVFKYMFEISSSAILDILTFIVSLLVTTSYYYSDVYNWWNGVPSYSGTMALCVITCAYILKYNAGITNKKSYAAMIILGMITCTSMMYCVAIGAFYVLYTFIIYFKNGDSIKRKVMPLLLYIITGVLMVIAPGNYARMNGEMHVDNSISGGIFVTGYRLINRFVVTLHTKPWVVALMLLIFLIGLAVGNNRKHSLIGIVFGIVCTFAASFCALFLYVYSSNKGISDEIVPRIYYVEDYMVFIAMAFIVFAFGAWLKQIAHIDFSIYKLGITSACLVTIAVAYILVGGHYKSIIQVDIVNRAALIKESWEFWDDILVEIENAEPNSDVVIDRENVDWCQYCYYVGLDDIKKEKLSEEARYGNCNECASKYYGVDSIVVNLN